jgi:CheY-like chemotaxis protein
MVPLKPYVLLGEDDEDDVAFFREVFSSRYPHVDILHFDNGRDVLEFLKNCPPDCIPEFILLDSMMPMTPAMDILEVLQYDLRYQKVVKAVWTTFAVPADRDHCLALGGSYYFDKPISKMEWIRLAAAVGSHFGQKATGS